MNGYECGRCERTFTNRWSVHSVSTGWTCCECLGHVDRTCLTTPIRISDSRKEP